jgi:hypothetical protein
MRDRLPRLLLQLHGSLALALLVAACGGSGGGLSGSICSTYDCSYNTVTIRALNTSPITTVQIDYTDGPVTATTARAAVVVCDVSNVVTGQPVAATDVHHIAADGVGFPSYVSGQCTFTTDLVVGQDVSGSFHATFATEAGTVRALMGSFHGPLEAAQ